MRDELDEAPGHDLRQQPALVLYDFAGSIYPKPPKASAAKEAPAKKVVGKKQAAKTASRKSTARATAK